MTWEEDLEEKKKRADYAKEMGGIERIAKNYTQGRLTVRERIDLLLDEGSFHETGEITGKVSYDEDGNLKDFIPSNFIFGKLLQMSFLRFLNFPFTDSFEFPF